MRTLSTVSALGETYESVWAIRGKIDPAAPTAGGWVVAVRRADGAPLAVIRRNATMAEVEVALKALRDIGLSDAELSALFNHRGKGLPQHIKELVANLRT